MPLFPWMQLAGLLMLAAILVTMGIDPNLYVSWVYGVPWLILISAAYFLWRARQLARLLARLPRAPLSCVTWSQVASRDDRADAAVRVSIGERGGDRDGTGALSDHSVASGEQRIASTPPARR